MGVEGCVECLAEVRWLEAGVEEEYIAFLINVLNAKMTSRSGTLPAYKLSVWHIHQLISSWSGTCASLKALCLAGTFTNLQALSDTITEA